MPIHSLTSTLTWLCISLFITACGGGKPPESQDSADEVAAESAPEDETKEASKDKADSDEADTAADEADAEKPAARGEPTEEESQRLTRTPKDIVSAPDVVFMLAYNDSDPKKEAEKKCDEKAGNDPKKKNECMAKERKKVTIDGLQFKQENGKWWWLTLRKQGTRLVNLHKVEFQFGKEDKASVAINPLGKDKGAAPWARVPKEVVIEVPNEYQIAVEDPQLGKLVYDAKIGIVGN